MWYLNDCSAPVPDPSRTVLRFHNAFVLTQLSMRLSLSDSLSMTAVLCAVCEAFYLRRKRDGAATSIVHDVGGWLAAAARKCLWMPDAPTRLHEP